jgi:NADH dehydrogenase
VFGGTGFLGRSVVRHLRLHGFCVRVASRHPDRGHALLGPDDPQLRSIKVDVRDERSVTDALADAYGAVNAVSLYLERGQETFHSIHVESAERIAAQAQRCGVKRLIHVSGIGADARSQSLYIRKRGEGELAVRKAFADAILIRPAVMFGPNDAFLTTILKLLNRLPVFPMFGNGQMRLQPVYVEDVGQAIAKIMQGGQTGSTTFECGGPRVYSYEELLRAVASAAGNKPILFPVPFAAWGALARISELLPSPPITRNQVELMQIDSVSMPELPGLEALGIRPHAVEEILQEILRTH